MALLSTMISGQCIGNPVQSPRAQILLPAAIDPNAQGGLPLRMLLDIPMRDPNVTLAPDGYYYLVGTTDPAPGYTTIGASGLDSQMWQVNDGIRMWKSRDMVHWDSFGLIYSLDKDALGTWAHTWVGPNPGRAIWAPEIHFLRGTFWIPYCTKREGGYGAGLLKSVSGKAVGPYKEVHPSAPLGTDVDASLFEDSDGTVYFLWADYNIARMNANMTDLAETPRKVSFAQPPGWGEGIFMAKVRGKYIFINSGTSVMKPGLPQSPDNPTTYDCFSAVSSGSIYGPYSPRYRAIPHDGHNNLFKDKQGDWWTTYFGSDPNAPFSVGASGRPAVLPITIDRDGLVHAKRREPRPKWKYTTSDPGGNWTDPKYSDRHWSNRDGAFGDFSVSQNGNVTDVGTRWTIGDIWLRKSISINGDSPATFQYFIRHSGPCEIYINGVRSMTLTNSSDEYQTLSAAGSTASFKHGRNVIAVHCKSGESSRSYFDIGIITPEPLSRHMGN